MGESTEPLVRYEVRDRVAYCTLNRPEVRNAQNVAMLQALDDAFRAACADDEVGVIVLRGAGKHFSAGHDIGTPGRDIDKAFERRASHLWEHVGRPGAENTYVREADAYLGLCERWRALPKPTICQVHGACIAGGLMLAWVCDLIVASDDAFFADPVLRMGIPGVEFFAHPYALNPRAAKEFLFTGDRMSAARALEIGMVNRVVPRDALDDEVSALAARIAEKPRFALLLAKQAINQAEDRMGLRDTLHATYGYHHLAHAHNTLSSEDYLQGQTARSMKDGMKDGS